MAKRKKSPATEESQDNQERARPPRPATGSERPPQELTREQLEALRNRLQKKFH